MDRQHINYSDLNARQKERYNFHKIAAVLADYGCSSIKLDDDWQAADFIEELKNEQGLYYNELETTQKF